VSQPSHPDAQPGVRLRGLDTVFLDRDGTINVKASQGRYITSPVALVLIPGAATAIARLNAAAIRVVLVTNQRWLAGPAGDLSGYARVHACLEELLAAGGAHLDAAYFCPHERGRCGCRKPLPGMLQRAAADHGFGLGAAVMIGDSATDVAAGRAAGTRTILLGAAAPFSAGADLTAVDLAHAVDLLLSERGR
jgi:D-glycero-D-manno-heptose 1,7-bisphosphate phosphatase